MQTGLKQTTSTQLRLMYSEPEFTNHANNVGNSTAAPPRVSRGMVEWFIKKPHPLIHIDTESGIALNP